MAVRVAFLGILKKHQPEADDKGFWHPDAAGKTLEELLASTTLGESGMSTVLLVNGGREKLDYVLRDDDKVQVMPMVAGG